MEHIIIIGGGVGGALAHDLALRGFRVTLVEKGGLLSGTSGRHHGLLHSGARYVLHDLKTARECAEENQILRHIAPDALELNDGLFVALDDADTVLWDRFDEKCHEAGIPHTPLSASQTLAMEPELVPTLRGAFQVCDATMDAWRLPLQFFATALCNGAKIRTFSEVISIRTSGRSTVGVEVMDHRVNRVETIGADLVVNAAGPWTAKVAAMADIQIPLRTVPGVMVSVPARLNRMVINRLHPAGEGDIIVPQRNLSIMGTTAWVATDPDTVEIPSDHVKRLFELGKQLIPGIMKYAAHSVWYACRPLLDAGEERDPMRISRTFDCLDHAERDDMEGIVTVLGGKATTMRAMAEKTADLICRKTGRDLRCRTREVVLKPYRTYYEYH
ncbi:MAG: FAD-dependent oxidoreductase [Desulfobacterales bacterium]|jgi:glycerol-3-phosphate dehydrogenase